MRDKIFLFIKNNPAILITVLSAYGYYCAYFFQLGYCLFFKIPSIYINIEIVDIISFTGTTVGVFLVMLFYLRGVFFDKSPNQNRNYIRSLFLEFNILAYVFYYFLNSTILLSSLFYYIFLPLVVVINIGIALYSLHTKRKAKRLANKYINEFPDATGEFIKEKVIADFNFGKSSVKRQITSIETTLNYLLFLVIILPAVCMFKGYGDASKSSNFSFLTEQPSIAVLRRYGDEIICKNYDFKNKRFGDTIQIFKLDGQTKLKFTIQEIK